LDKMQATFKDLTVTPKEEPGITEEEQDMLKKVRLIRIAFAGDHGSLEYQKAITDIIPKKGPGQEGAEAQKASAPHPGQSSWAARTAPQGRAAGGVEAKSDRQGSPSRARGTGRPPEISTPARGGTEEGPTHKKRGAELSPKGLKAKEEAERQGSAMEDVDSSRERVGAKGRGVPTAQGKGRWRGIMPGRPGVASGSGFDQRWEESALGKASRPRDRQEDVKVLTGWGARQFRQVVERRKAQRSNPEGQRKGAKRRAQGATPKERVNTKAEIRRKGPRRHLDHAQGHSTENSGRGARGAHTLREGTRRFSGRRTAIPTVGVGKPTAARTRDGTGGPTTEPEEVRATNLRKRLASRLGSLTAGPDTRGGSIAPPAGQVRPAVSGSH
jgi:hypothetical protein